MHTTRFPTRIAIVHYHLHLSGVSSVIGCAMEGLEALNVACVTLTGGNVEGLGYLTDPGDLTAAGVLEKMRMVALTALGGPPDLWHFHNHSLGKNILMGDIVALLAEAGEPMVLQIHDLAEQGRPSSHAVIAGKKKIYPFGPRIRYGFLNSRDVAVFVAAGLPEKNAILLPNPIKAVDRPHCAPIGTAPLLFAPVRGIRRKNIGELVMLSALIPDGGRVAISRAPLNPEAIPVHDQWRKFAAKQHLPIGFDVVDRFAPTAGASAGFESWVSYATHIVTTSVSEGFGLPFLEAVAWRKPLIGRNLPHLEADHDRHDIHMDNLYDRILVPVEWIDLTVLRSHLVVTLERNYRCYGRDLAPATIEATLASLVKNGLVDFGNLPEALQQEMVERLIDPDSRRVPLVQTQETIQPLTHWLAGVLSFRESEIPVSMLEPFSCRAYRDRLHEIYQDLRSMPDGEIHYIDPPAVLDAHLTPEQFHFLLSALPPVSPAPRFRAVIFDIYGTLLVAPSGGVKPDSAADPALRRTIEYFGYPPPDSPSKELHAAVLRHHAASGHAHPEVDVRVLWREVLELSEGTDLTEFVTAIEGIWHPCVPVPGAVPMIRRLARSGVSLGLLSNAQCNTLHSLGDVAFLFPPELTVLSYQHGIAKPDPMLFKILADRLGGRGIPPAETLYIGNDPLHDILPASAVGFRTALFSGHPDSFRHGDCSPDYTLRDWSELADLV